MKDWLEENSMENTGWIFALGIIVALILFCVGGCSRSPYKPPFCKIEQLSYSSFYYDFKELKQIEIFGYNILIGKHIPSNWDTTGCVPVTIHTWEDYEQYRKLLSKTRLYYDLELTAKEIRERIREAQ